MSRVFAVLSIVVCCRLVPGAEPIDFSRDIQPLLAKRCVACHGPDTQEAGLRLDEPAGATRELDSGERAIVPGDATASEMLARLTSSDPDIQMPPEGPRVAAGDIDRIRQWINEGAEWKGHWAFQPLVRPAVPPGAAADNPIDAFINASLSRRGLPTPQSADKATLLRRATYDLTGLPPSAQEVRDFLADTSPGAWERVIDRLLASPHYGEKWARHWLDLVRYADTNSFERDGDKPHAWRYRDYVIRSLNDDKPYDEFIIEQLAGDELPDPSSDALIATGYYRLGTWDDEPADKLQARYDWFDDLVATTGQTFLGLTINCARRRAEARRNLQGLETRIKEQGEQVLDDLARQDLAALMQLVAALEKEHAGIAKALVVSEHGPRAPDTFVFYRGNPHAETTPEHRVEPAFPAVLRPEPPVIPTPTPGGATSGRRTALARWIASPDNPLTARVMVNRIWQHHFGRGLVRSSSNFGFAGDPPTHPELLDWLAVEFSAGGWRLKPLVERLHARHVSGHDPAQQRSADPRSRASR